MFEQLFKLGSNQENTMAQDTYIYREIKLDKELRKIKKKIRNDMGREELRRILPYEEFLTKALKDNDSESSESQEEDDENMTKATDQIPCVRVIEPQILINDITESAR